MFSAQSTGHWSQSAIITLHFLRGSKEKFTLEDVCERLLVLIEQICTPWYISTQKISNDVSEYWWRWFLSEKNQGVPSYFSKHLVNKEHTKQCFTLKILFLNKNKVDEWVQSKSTWSNHNWGKNHFSYSLRKNDAMITLWCIAPVLTSRLQSTTRTELWECSVAWGLSTSAGTRISTDAQSCRSNRTVQYSPRPLGIFL